MLRRAAYFALTLEMTTAALMPAHASDLVDRINLKPLFDARFRTERVGREDFSDDAIAHTLRVRGGVALSPFDHVDIVVEGEGIVNLNDRFNSTTNGQTQFPVIPDPEALELNQAYISYSGLPKTKISIGRQKIAYGNQRFVGAVDFRQNQQTFDAARVSLAPFDNASIEYVYIDRVHRIFGNDNPVGDFSSDSHVIQASYNAGSFGDISAYGLLLDFSEAPALSSATWGVRIQNKVKPLADNDKFKVSYAFEYAHQEDYGQNATQYSADYWLVEGGLGYDGFSVKAGFESLGGDGVIGFSTPLATLHKFQGFADAFLATPADGVEDLYVVVGATKRDVLGLKALSFHAFAHDFQSARGGADLGRELDLKLSAKITKHLSAELKGAIFDGGSSGPPDRNVLWASIRFKL